MTNKLKAAIVTVIVALLAYIGYEVGDETITIINSIIDSFTSVE